MLGLAAGSNHYGAVWSRFWVAAIPVGLVALLWLTDEVLPDSLLREAPLIRLTGILETSWTYAYLHLFTFFPVLLLSFDRNVRYYTRWKFLFPAIAIVGVFFIAWDVFFTIKGVWGFNETYLLGVGLLGLPVEEWLFFVTVPFACVFIYECLNFYVKRDWLGPYEKKITLFLACLFLAIGLFNWGRMYTTTTFLLSGGFMLFHFLFLEGAYRGRFYFAYLVSMVPFLLVNGVLTGGYTQEPIVMYNPGEYLGIRLTSIPLDDTVYGFLLLMGVVTLYERFQASARNAAA